MPFEGALPSQHIRELIRNSSIIGADEANIEAASLDLTVSDRVWRLPHRFLPNPGEFVQGVAERFGAEIWSYGYPLEVDVLYLAKLNEELALPDVYGYANPKSSSGRLDLHVSLVADGLRRFDSAGQSGYRGSLWAIISPKSFRTKLKPGEKLTQVRFFYSDTRLKQCDLMAFVEEYKVLWSDDAPVPFSQIPLDDADGSLILSVDLKGHNGIIGYHARHGVQLPVDFSRRDYDPNDFFEPIPPPKNGILVLRKGDFYILATRERLRVPPTYAAEIVPMDARAGEFRSHYAGFFDPGFGYGQDGEIEGNVAVLEVRPFENLLLRHGQPMAKFTFERVAERPDMVYGGSALSSNYSRQISVRLGKQFRVS